MAHSGHLQGQRDIDALARYCEFVQIDPRRTDRGQPQPHLISKRGLKSLFSRRAGRASKSEKHPSPPGNSFVPKPRHYYDGVSMKAAIDSDLLNKPARLTDDEFNTIKEHVRLSLDLVQKDNKVDARVLNIIATHHERNDGSGYPEGLQGVAIPLLGRIVSLADSYDAMITPRPYAPARSSFEAMQELSDLRDSRFQPELVEQFMQAIGLFPTGSLVELTTGEVAIVVAQNPTRRLKPKVIVILDADKKRHKSFVTIDLQSLDFGGESSRSIWITRELEVGAYGIEPEDYYL